MTKVCVFLPTYRTGGIDVFEASILRQTVKPDLIYIADELRNIREETWKSTFVRMGETFNFDARFMSLMEDDPAYKRNLCYAYNEAVGCIRDEDRDIDLLISLQDYIYLPEDGIERFVKLHEIYPSDLLTGITHISRDPLVNSVANPSGLYSIFSTEFYDKPKLIGWRDPREDELYHAEWGTILQVAPEHWEANWAAIPMKHWRDGEGAYWDEEFDKGIAYENMDFAQTYCKTFNAKVILDRDNQAISLPHKKYWPEEEKEIEEFSNRERYEAKWMNLK